MSRRKSETDADAQEERIVITGPIEGLPPSIVGGVISLKDGVGTWRLSAKTLALILANPHCHRTVSASEAWTHLTEGPPPRAALQSRRPRPRPHYLRPES